MRPQKQFGPSSYAPLAVTGGAIAVFALGWVFGAVWAGTRRKPPPDDQRNDYVEIDPNTMDRSDLELRRVRKVETVVMRRTSRVMLVLERTAYEHNYSAVMRTAEAMGVQNVWVICPPREGDVHAGGAKGHQRRANELKKKEEGLSAQQDEHSAFAKGACEHLWIRTFETTAACVTALRDAGYTLWVTELSQVAESLHSPALAAEPMPAKLAVAFGTESTGASPTLLRAADRRVYLPLNGFADSLNLSVSAAVIVQRIFALCGPSVIGDMSLQDRRRLRREWYPRLAKTAEQREQYLAMVDTPPPPLSDLRVVNNQRRVPLKKTVEKLAGRGDAFEVGIGH